jgi:hypothetical protein
MRAITIFFSAILLCPLILEAAGTFALQGQIKSFSPEKIAIFDGHNTYELDRSKLNLSESNKLKSVKVGTKIQLQVPFTAVASVKKQK